MLIGQSQALNPIFWIGTASFFALTLLIRSFKWIRYVLPVVPIVMIGLIAGLGQWAGIREFINWLCGPQRLLFLSAMMLVLSITFYRRWTKPWFAGALGIIFVLAFILSAFDHNFFKIVSKPDNMPITLLIFSIGFFLWVAYRRMAINDERAERGKPPAEGKNDEQVMVWPDLVLAELIIMVICTVVLIIWSIFFRAPLELPADPTTVPNPSKAPWYFLGLQELLVYFDPWIAGVLLPLLTIFGLCALPYLDKNPKGNGYYTLKERPFAIAVFLFGFVVLWVMPIVLGTFLRGPNWNFYGPFEYWDPHRLAVLINVNLSDIFWIRLLGTGLPTEESLGTNYFYLAREAPGLLILAAYFGLTPWILKATVFKNMYARMGWVRFTIMMILLTWMALVPIKMLLRWLFNLKYILAITEWSFNI